MKPRVFLFGIALLMLLTGCKKAFQYSLLEVRPLARDLNVKAVEQIRSLPQKSSFTFLVISDTQIALGELSDFVKYANKHYTEEGIAFVLHGGDITDFGANYEYNDYYNDIKKLKFPNIATIGNHDMLGNGPEIYRKYFGPDDFTFRYGKSAFIVFNSNSRERGFDGTLPNEEWLAQQIRQTDTQETDHIFFLSHVPPMSADFDPNKVDSFTELLASTDKASLSIHGHTHVFSYDEPYNDGMPYLIAPSLEKRSFVEVTVEDQSISVNLIHY
ncbi:metallophosphoesterase [Sphingobacterium alkalisoli]|uniref:Metallophosphoesterase n=1 Tax=Sphingobacterium alkalisoli TaxID=1874115 RepID=A0A4U0GQW6_9SPHI|nr:metallophosphoesterase [Sphingobacterium alkalisoli]TJY61341.1 metallophosphoesterase [Sphingobacterium alkalisoli]